MSDIVIGTRLFAKVDPLLAAMFLEAGIARTAEEAAAENKQQKQVPVVYVPTFGIGVNASGKATIVLTMPDGSVSKFDGKVENARDAFKSMKWDATEQKRTLQGPEPSQDVINAYDSRKMYEAEQAEANDRARQGRS